MLSLSFPCRAADQANGLPHSGQNFGCWPSGASQPQPAHFAGPAGRGLPHSAQNLPWFTAPQAHVQLSSAGFGLPHSPQNFPVLPVLPHLHVQPPAAGAAGCRSGLCGLLLRAHLIEILRVHAARLSRHVHAHERHRGACALIGRGRLHGGRLCADEVRCRSRRVHECRVALHLLEHLLVFLARLDAGYAERDDFQTTQITPLARQHFIQRVGQLHRVTGKRGIADAHVGDLRKRGLKRGQQLGLELAVEPVARVVLTARCRRRSCRTGSGRRCGSCIRRSSGWQCRCRCLPAGRPRGTAPGSACHTCCR